MREIEERYPEDIVVIGVHSGKYIAERETPRILEASLRFGLTHPVINDRQFRVWRAYAVRAWPTLVVIDKKGYVVGAHAGEFTVEMIQPFLEQLMSLPDEGKGKPIPSKPERPAIAPVKFRYPQKVAVEGTRIAISDTGNGRVLIGSLESPTRARIEKTVTGSLGGLGKYSEAHSFRSPQGLVFDGDTLLVADSETHCIYEINPTGDTTRTLAGTGQQLRSQRDRESGALSSPWDLTIVGRTLFVAMAGIHQLWAIDRDTGSIRIHSGAGGEDIMDGRHADALLAQPMGITTDGERLYFADSESSAVRWADAKPKGQVGTIVGTGLFDFGDVDGTGDSVRMQHQQGVALHPNGELIVADSYNDALKLLDAETREARTWVRGFHEPGGVAAGEHHAYVADTNAHRIMVVEFSTGTMQELEIIS
ncbi:MAG TPA: alkyl hydroperoxide reductase [Steroidobacteraceae bacterium]|nr:alkyl hydroperoxide reductase [Steroidobacteraceae bacterium]